MTMTIEEIRAMPKVLSHDTEWLTINTMKSSFAHFDERLHLINEVIKPTFAARAKANEGKQ